MTEWSESLNDWGAATNLGPSINTDDDEWCAYAPDKKTLIYVRNVFTSKILISRWNDTTQAWSVPTSLEQEQVSRGVGIHGITMPARQHKIYVGTGFAVNGIGELEVAVSYYDSTAGKFTKPLRLNLNAHPPPGTPSHNPENRGYDAFPSVTSDGKWMFFQSDRAPDSLGTNFHDIYASRLLVDEKGDTVITSIYDDVIEHLYDVRLMQNYPNPFNAQTTIEYSLNKRGYVVIEIYDSLGKRIRRLVEGTQEAGNHSTRWEGGDEAGRRVATGVYYYRLSVDGTMASTKRLLMLR